MKVFNVFLYDGSGKQLFEWIGVNHPFFSDKTPRFNQISDDYDKQPDELEILEDSILTDDTGTNYRVCRWYNAPEKP